MGGKYYEFEFYVNGTYMRQSIPVVSGSYSSNAKNQLYSMYPNAQNVTYKFVDMDRINEEREREQKRKREYEEKKYKQEEEEKFRRYQNELQRQLREQERKKEREEEKIRIQKQKELEEIKKIERERLLEERYNNLSLEDKLYLEDNSKKLEKIKKINNKIVTKLVSYCFFIFVKILIVYFAYNYSMSYYSNKIIFSFDFSNIMKILVILLAIIYIIKYIRYFLKKVLTNYYELIKYVILISSIVSLNFFDFKNEIKYGIYFLILLFFILIVLSPLSHKNKRYKKIQKLNNETKSLLENFKKEKGLILEI